METGRGQLGWGHEDHGQGSREGTVAPLPAEVPARPRQQGGAGVGAEGPGKRLPQGWPPSLVQHGDLNPAATTPRPPALAYSTPWPCVRPGMNATQPWTASKQNMCAC